MISLAQVVERTISSILSTKKRGTPSKRWDIGENGHTTNHLDVEKAQKVVNEYGMALERASYHNRREIIRLINNLANGEESAHNVSASLWEKRGRPYDLFALKCDISLLPYPKETIREAIELLLKYEKCPENIQLLESGLRYLEAFA